MDSHNGNKINSKKYVKTYAELVNCNCFLILKEMHAVISKYKGFFFLTNRSDLRTLVINSVNMNSVCEVQREPTVQINK